MEVLVVVDLQNDFIDGALGNIGNEEIVNPIEDYIEKFRWRSHFYKRYSSWGLFRNFRGKEPANNSLY